MCTNGFTRGVKPRRNSPFPKEMQSMRYRDDQHARRRANRRAKRYSQSFAYNTRHSSSHDDARPTGAAREDLARRARRRRAGSLPPDRYPATR
ncbi:hypothetical protein C9I57_10880 [Trinickia symbiotica]|uniref:Uncharacterized protein n=1 Tax=Trinickia symbiotica TaxID=863227 RepID=A0A2T3XV48_9BURK|nr:hypothetical protein C9I57_10880 [Trinickia symbiotica]